MDKWTAVVLGSMWIAGAIVGVALIMTLGKEAIPLIQWAGGGIMTVTVIVWLLS